MKDFIWKTKDGECFGNFKIMCFIGESIQQEDGVERNRKKSEDHECGL